MGITSASDPPSFLTSFTTTLKHAVRILYRTVRSTAIILPWLTHLFLADLLLSFVCLPLTPLFPTTAYNLSSYLASSVWYSIQHIFTNRNNASIIVSGLSNLPPLPVDGREDGESAIVVANHAEWTDFYMVQELAIRQGMLGRCRWFAKKELKWVPFLGWGLWAMRMPLVSRRWVDDKKEMERVFYGITDRKLPVGLISFSEATRYTPAKRAATIDWCKAHSKPVPPGHLLYPRTKGFVATVSSLRDRAPHVKAVYDLTIAYANGKKFMVPPSFLTSITVPDLVKAGWRFWVHVERFSIEDLPKDEEKLGMWLEERWIEKGERLEGLREKLEAGDDWDALN
ncbi:hypothetical protein K431DRAFT_281347 [Polychaeton citri CBS 116435]|uniref:Phospholipid/glycerol acyltransferase domain-containing protein n=1 Tax=Polychaeton citri CBS 116435 TaxID=1314669 RepID=A0A9P4QHA3_9PEZI|nr:hypothetical protein K431DRAFT_281347 [Polychaeton citri CBS 116435]